MSRGPGRIGLVWWLILGLILFAAAGSAQQRPEVKPPPEGMMKMGPAEAYTRMGAGLSSCGTWVAERRRGDWSTSGSWVLGFLSGVGYMGTPQYDPLHGMDGDAVLAWIDNYCQTNALLDIVDAAEAFVTAHPH